KFAVIVPALKLPEPSLFTIAFGVLVAVAAFAAVVAKATFAADCPPTKDTTVAPCVPVTSPANDPVKFVVLPAVVAVVAVVALPFKFAVIVPALKFPDGSRDTIAFAVFAFVAVVAEFATLPAVVIVASFVSTMPAAGSTSALTISDVDKSPNRLL